MDACGYIKKGWIVDNAINALLTGCFVCIGMALRSSAWAKMMKLVAVTRKRVIKRNF